MAGKPKPMSQIKQLLELHRQGKSIKFIARSLGIARERGGQRAPRAASQQGLPFRKPPCID